MLCTYPMNLATRAIRGAGQNLSTYPMQQATEPPGEQRSVAHYAFDLSRCASTRSGSGFLPSSVVIAMASSRSSVSTTVPFGQLAFGVLQIKRPDQTALRVSY